MGVFGGSGGRIGTSVGIGIPLGGFGEQPPDERVVSLARIPVTDMAAYRAGWRDWRLRLQLGTPETGVRFLEAKAPEPPPA